MNCDQADRDHRRLRLLSPGFGVGLLPSDPAPRSGVVLLGLTDPEVVLRAFAVTNLGRESWPPLALVLRLISAGADSVDRPDRPG